MSKNNYQIKWTKSDRLGGGGQGLTYKALSIPDDGNIYALKILKQQRDQDRRERMFVEVSALQILEHAQIPRYIDSNAADYKTNEEDLYLVTEFIPGPTLQEFIDSNGILQLSDALNITIGLIDVTAFCHSKGTFHRDIKPDNIIVSENDLNKPFLIDFGLSFNEDIPKADTPSWQHIGNRFLALPELRVSEGNKKDHRSDITMVCGILLFCLTGIHPTDLIDENQTKPHRRSKSKIILEKLDKERLSLLNRIFDIGFNVGINDRWQSLESLKKELSQLLNLQSTNSSDTHDMSEMLEHYKNYIENRMDFKQLDRLKEIFDHIELLVNRSNAVVREKISLDQHQRYQTGYFIDFSKQLYSNTLGFSHRYSDKLSFIPKFSAYVNGSELVIEAVEQGQRTELIRHPLNVELNWNTIEQSFIDYYIGGVLSKRE